MTDTERDKLNGELAEMLEPLASLQDGLDDESVRSPLGFWRWQPYPWAAPARWEPIGFCSDLNAAHAMGERLLAISPETAIAWADECKLLMREQQAYIGTFHILQFSAEQRALAAHAVLKARTTCPK